MPLQANFIPSVGINVAQVVRPGAPGYGVVPGGTTGQILAKRSDDDFDTEWLFAGLTGTPNKLARFASDGTLVAVDESDISALGAQTFTFNRETDNGAYEVFMNHILNVNSDVQSDSQTYNLHYLQANITGAQSFGTDGDAITLNSLYLSHNGQCDTGALTFSKMSADIGNGVDAITIDGYAYSFGFSGFHGPVTVKDYFQGYIFQPGFDPEGEILGYVNAFADFANMPISVGGYTSLNLTPIIGEIKNNSNYQGIYISPNIAAFVGNGSVNCIFLGGQYEDPEYFNGILINPDINDAQNVTLVDLSGVVNCDNYTALRINTSNVTGTNVKAAEITGDVSVDGDFSFTGSLNIGRLNAFGSVTIEDGTPGAPVSVHSMVSQFIGAANETIVDFDAIGVNTAALIEIGDNCSITSGLIGLGVSAIALPNVLKMGVGSSIDVLNAAVYALSMDATATGGYVDVVNLCQVVTIPNGITEVDKLRGFYFSDRFGNTLINKGWCLYSESETHPAYVKRGILIGEDSDSIDTACAIQIKSTTKAIAINNLTSSQRDALPTTNPFVIVNSDTNELQIYLGGSWRTIQTV